MKIEDVHAGENDDANDNDDNHDDDDDDYRWWWWWWHMMNGRESGSGRLPGGRASFGHWRAPHCKAGKAYWAYCPRAEWVFRWLQILVTCVLHLARCLIGCKLLPTLICHWAAPRCPAKWLSCFFLGFRLLSILAHCPYIITYEYWAFTGSAVARLGILPPCILCRTNGHWACWVSWWEGL